LLLIFTTPSTLDREQSGWVSARLKLLFSAF